MCPKPSSPKIPDTTPEVTPAAPPPEATPESPGQAEGAGRSQAQNTQTANKQGTQALQIALNVPGGQSSNAGGGLNIPTGA